jgi:hypothetical protein
MLLQKEKSPIQERIILFRNFWREGVRVRVFGEV